MSSTGRYLPVGLQGLIIARRPKFSPEPGWLIFFLPSASAGSGENFGLLAIINPCKKTKVLPRTRLADLL